MDVEEVLKNAKMEALQADPEMTVCLVITVGEGTELTEGMTNDIYYSVSFGLSNTKWNGIPIFVVPEGTKIEAVVVPKQEGNVNKPTAMVDEIEIQCRSGDNQGSKAEALNIAGAFKHHLQQTNLWKRRLIPDWEIRVVQLDNGWSIGLRTANVEAPEMCFSNAHFNVNIIGQTFYLLDIELVDHLRGRGYETELYETLEKIAKDLKCTRIEQTPSGTIRLSGKHREKESETRATWLQRRGWLLETPKDHIPIAYKNL